VSAAERRRQTVRIVEVRLSHLGAQPRELAGPGRPGMTRDGSHQERAVGVLEDGTGKTAALGPGCADYGHYLTGRHAKASRSET
jgi:hypothetical protein